MRAPRLLPALALAALALAALASGPARAERLILSLSNDEVAISSNFTGAQLVAFGIVERDAQSASRTGRLDVVITVRGPREAITIRRKAALGPIWLNRDQQKFIAVPALLGVYTSRPLKDIANEAFRRKARIGIDAIVDAPDLTFDRGGDDDPFRAALIRLKSRDRLYSETERSVVFVTDDFFRVPISLPATAPLGAYEIDAALLADGIAVGRQTARFTVLKAGFEEQVTRFARDRPLVHGLATAAVAVLFGWLASVIFRRD